MRGEPVVVLLIEDEMAHAEIVRRNFEEFGIANMLVHVQDGQAGLDYLYRRGDFADAGRAPRPGLILLDLRLPKVEGLEVLKTIKSDPLLARIPVIVLTTSAAESDKLKAYDCHANSYLVKPVELPAFVDMMKALGYYWLVWNEFPY